MALKIRRMFAGAAVKTTTTGAVASSGAVTIAIADATGWPDGSTGKYAIVVSEGTANEEKIAVTSRTGTVLTVASGDRGYDGTTAKAHANGDTIRLTQTAIDFDEANDHASDATLHVPATGLTASGLAANAVTTAKILDANVTASKMAAASVTSGVVALDELRLGRVAAQSIPINTLTAISWDTAFANAANYITVPGAQVTIPVGKGGIYLITFNAGGATATYGYSQISVGGTAYTSGEESIESHSAQYVTAVVRMADAATLNCYVKQTTGTVNYTATLMMVRLGA
jgi:hypothetical protein